MDVWGSIYRDHHEGRVYPHVIERDDGLEHEIPSAEAYFSAPRSEMERQYLDALKGGVLDLGAGAGSHALYLQARGLQVTAVDSSEGAIEICQRRGCRDARTMDLRSLELEHDHYSAIIVMGNTLGVHQTPQSLPTLLNALARAARPGARLLSVNRDPLETDDPHHLRYQQRNRDHGRPAGLSIIRLRYRGSVDEWVPLWMPTREEFHAAVADSVWSVVEDRPQGPNRFWLLEFRGATV